MSEVDDSTADVPSMTVTLGADGHFRQASPAALEVLGVSLCDVVGRSPRTLLAISEAESQALSETWRSGVAHAAAGEATVARPDGTMRRVRFVLGKVSEGTYEVILEDLGLASAPALPSGGLSFYTIAEVLAAWRAAERRLEDTLPGSQQWTTTAAEAEAFRRQYLRLFASKQRSRARRTRGV